MFELKITDPEITPSQIEWCLSIFDWEDSEELRKQIIKINNRLKWFLQGYLRRDIRVRVIIYTAMYSKTLGSMIDILMSASAQNPEIVSIHVYNPETSSDLLLPFLFVNNRTRLYSEYTTVLLNLCHTITTEWIFPRYIIMPTSCGNDGSAKRFMQMVHHRMYRQKSNTKLVTFNDSLECTLNTVTIMQYMHAKQQYEKDIQYTLCYIHFARGKKKEGESQVLRKLPPELRRLPQELGIIKPVPSTKKLWQPQIKHYRCEKKLMWIYNRESEIDIDGSKLVFTFPTVKMTISAIRDLMISQVEPMDGHTIECYAEFKLNVKGGLTDIGKNTVMNNIQMIIGRYINKGFKHTRVYKGGHSVFKLSMTIEHPHGGQRTCRISIYPIFLGGIHMIVAYSVVRPQPKDTDPSVGGDGVRDIDTGVRCVGCMKPVLTM